MHYCGTDSESDKDIKELHKVLGEYDDKNEYEEFINLLKKYIPTFIKNLIIKIINLISWNNNV